ncbi:MAG: GNAT family N-acetyltransferase [Bacteroidota bacterium]
MSDMLVKLYELPEFNTLKKALEAKGYIFKRPIAPEKTFTCEWVKSHFSNLWADEASIAFSKLPVSCFLAIKDKEIAGFACYETSSRGFFGPTGVAKKFRGEGVGKILLLLALQALKDLGYAYAIIGGVGPKEFYEKNVGAMVIPNSDESIYKNLLKL